MIFNKPSDIIISKNRKIMSEMTIKEKFTLRHKYVTHRK